MRHSHNRIITLTFVTYTDADRKFLESREFPAFETEFGEFVHERPLPDSIPVSLGLRAAYFFFERYLAAEKEPVEEMVIFWAYLTGDPAAEEDWNDSVRRAVDSLE